MIRVLVADDQPLIRYGLSTFLDAADGIRVVGQAESGRDAVVQAQRLRPDVVLMDVRMPEGGGLQATRVLRTSEQHRPKVVVMTTFDVDDYLFTALDLGASGFFLKDADPDELAEAVRVVARGGCAVARDLTPRLVAEFARRRARERPVPDHPLSARELEVVRELAKGSCNREVATALGLEVSTVKAHVSNIGSKLGLQGRLQIVVWAFTTGLASRADQQRTEAAR
ncbi:response regulator transcription factor [Cellulomonas iranensis]|uniref:response regulator transcription factor n=1 Tax=Cellulomonas iranensis TaxID=76862 RepID=UPI001CF5583D|nr:response regulator transcription factor [Cellulomonas iranensis]UCN15255.1 response regulator transcription factor [Cellulomonas iranensis]